MARRRATRWTIGIVGGVLLLVATSAIVVETPWFKERLRRIVVTRANETLNGELIVGHLTGSLITGVELHNVVFKQPGGPVFAAERIAVRYDPRILIRGRFVLDELTLTRPVIHVTQRAGGWNVANLVKPRTSSGKPPEVHFQELTIVDGDVRVEPAASTARRFANVNAALELTYSAAGTSFEVTSLRTHDVTTGLVIHGAGVKYEGRADRLTAMVNFNTSAGTLAGTLSAAPRDRGRTLDGHFSVTHLDLAPLLARADLKTDVTGNIQTQAVLPASVSTPATVSFQVEAPQVVAAGYDVRNAKAIGSYTEGILRFDGSGQTLGAFATAKGEWRTASAPRASGVIQLAGQFRGLDVRRVPASLKVPELASLMAGQYRVVYRPAAWAVDVQFSRSSLEGGEIGSGAVAHVSGGRGGRLEYAFKGRVARLDLQRIGRALRVRVLTEDRFRSQISGDVDAGGSGRSLESLRLRADATLTDSTIGKTHIPAATVHADVGGRELAADFAGPFEHLTNDIIGAGSTPLDLTGSTEGVHLVIRDLDAPLSLDAIEAGGHVVLSRSMLAGYEIDSADVDAALTGGSVTVGNLQVEGAELRATAKGTVALDPETESDLTFVIDTDNIATAARRFDQPIAGAAHIEGSLTGPYDRLRAQGTMKTREVRYGTSFDALTLNGTFGVDVDNQQWREVLVRAQTQASFVKLAGMEIAELTNTTTYHAGTLDLDARVAQPARTIELGGSILFEPEQDEIRLRKLAVTTANQVWALPDGREATIHYGGERVAVSNLTLARGAQRVSIDGVFGLNAAGAGTGSGLDVKAENLELADVNQLVSKTWDVTGVLNGAARITGTTASPEVQSTFTVTNGAVAKTPFRSVTAKVGFQNRQLTLDGTVDQQPGAQLHAVGTVPFAYGAGASAAELPMDLTVESPAIDIGLFQAFTDHLTSLKGAGQFNVRVTGTAKAPLLNGQASVTDASFILEPTGTAYKGGNARLRFEGEHVVVDQFVLQDEDAHTLTVEGGADVSAGRQLRTVDLHVIADDFHLLKNDFGDVALDADLKGTGPLQQLNITGQASVDRGRLEIDRLLERFNKTAYSTESVDPVVHEAAELVPAAAGTQKPEASAAKPAEAMHTSLFDSMRLDITVTMPDDLVMRARNLRLSEGATGLGSTNLTLGGVLNLQKEPGGNIILIGGVEVVRGFYDFQGRRFDIVRGSELRFRGTQPIDPALNVSAEREIGGVTAQVGVRGTARQPTLQLSSYPPLEESDILSLIVFGQTVNSLGESQRINLAERAGSLALGAVAGPLAASVGNALNVDLFEIRAEGQGGSPEVALGSQVGSRFFIGLRQEFGRDEMSTVSFEYRISRLLRLVTSVAQGAGQTHSTRRSDPTGTDLIFVIRY